MDPETTLEEIRQSIRSGDREATVQAVEDLSVWLNRGGFPPVLKPEEQLIRGRASKLEQLWAVLTFLSVNLPENN